MTTGSIRAVIGDATSAIADCRLQIADCVSPILMRSKGHDRSSREYEMMTAPIVEGQSAQLCPLLAAVFVALDQAGISYTLLRGYEELLGGAIDGDVDLLVAA